MWKVYTELGPGSPRVGMSSSFTERPVVGVKHGQGYWKHLHHEGSWEQENFTPIPVTAQPSRWFLLVAPIYKPTLQLHTPYLFYSSPPPPQMTSPALSILSIWLLTCSLSLHFPHWILVWFLSLSMVFHLPDMLPPLSQLQAMHVFPSFPGRADTSQAPLSYF